MSRFAERRLEDERKQREKQAAEEKRFHDLVLCCQRVDPQTQEMIFVNVGGKHFTATRDTLCKYPHSLLGVLFSGCFDLRKQPDGYCFLDRDGDAFTFVLCWLRTGVLPLVTMSASSAHYFGMRPHSGGWMSLLKR